MFSKETEAASPPMGVTPAWGRRDSGHLVGSPSARWSGTEPIISRMSRGGSRLWSNQGKMGVCAPALKLHCNWSRSLHAKFGR